MKGALYMLWDNAFANYALAGSSPYLPGLRRVTNFRRCSYLEPIPDEVARLSAPREGDTLFSCTPCNGILNIRSFPQPSTQKLVSNCASECLAHLSDEAVHSETYREDIPGVLAALDGLEGTFGDSLINKVLLGEALGKMEARFTAETRKHERNVRRSPVHKMHRTLVNPSFAVGVCPRRRHKDNYTRSSSLISSTLLTHPCWNSGDINNLPLASYTVYCNEIWSQLLNSLVSS